MVGSQTMAPYIASKHAVFGLEKTAALELAAVNIRVNAIGPAAIDNRICVRLNLNLVRRIRTLGKILFPTIYQWVGIEQMKRLPILHYSWLTTNQPTA
jgi:NAD(P)-dependent dehydrogenase (short-subunit alcohol dehydrogenase family)